jgi:agmatinase
MNDFLHRNFAGANTEYRDARYVIFGVPYDSTTSFRPGTRQGPAAIRDISYNFESYLPLQDTDFTAIPVADLGDLDTNVTIDDMVMEVEAAVREIVSDRKIPVMLGGEHSITTGAVRAVKPECYLVCDAHLDLRDEFRGSACNHACTTYRVYDEGITDIIIFGGRSGTAEQYAFARNHCTLYTADEIQKRGPAQIIREVTDHTQGRRVYLSIDADVIDSCLTPGLGTPEPFGLDPLTIRDLVNAVAPSAVAFDYVEVCPVYDHGQAATVAAQLVKEFIASHWFCQK